MMYKVAFTQRAKKELKKLDKQQAIFILAWIRKNLENCSNPRLHGKSLTANHSGQWRYRVGDYRLIAEIIDDTIVILILTIDHRKEIYKR